MCFELDSTYSRKHPFVLPHHVLCWKELIQDNRKLLSPHNFEPYVFGKVKQVIKFGMNKNTNTIGAGLHSNSHKKVFCWNTLFPAIIPMNTPFFYSSKYNELVSLSLVVFRTMDDLLAATAQTSIGSPVCLPKLR